jgi:hypothetical protein
MPTFYAHLAIEFFAGRPRPERTEVVLSALVDQTCRTYALSAEMTAGVQEEALHQAQRRGLLPMRKETRNGL